MLRPYCYVLFVMFSPVQGCLVGASWHVLRPYCYLLFVICYDCARKGCLVGGDQTCVTTLLLVVICYLLWLCPSRTANVRPCEGEKCFTAFCDSTAIARRFRCNRTAIVCQLPFPMFHAACRLVTPTRGNDGNKLAIVCKSISCAKVTGILTPLLAGYDLISYFCNRNPWISA